MTKPFSKICIIYNPKSTGNSRVMAKKLQKQLESKLPEVKIECIPTEFAKHAVELAQKIAETEDYPLIVSSSGDGGYNEVINGVMNASGSGAVCAVLPAGNANDHSRTMQKHPLHQQIISHKITQLDLLKITVTKGNSSTVRFAHSYAGLGLTPLVARELNQYKLNKFKETALAVKTFMRFEPVEIKRNGRVHQLDSLLFSNINQMAKMLTLAPENKPDDGLFEVVIFESATKAQLVGKLIKATIANSGTTKSLKKYSFETVKKTPMQLDGEVMDLPANSRVSIESAYHALLTVV